MSNNIRKSVIALGLILTLGAFLRFYKLAEYPVHLGHDEVSQLYDSISILQTGRDIYGVKFPFIFKSVNDYKPPFYTYATILPLLILGWQDVTIRIVGAFFGVLMIPGMFFFTQRLFNNLKISLISSLLTAIAPFEVFYSRKSFENVAGVFALIVGFGLLLGFVKNQKKKWQFFLGSIVLAFGMYTYFSHTILIPILYCMFLFIFRKKSRDLPILAIVVASLIVIPLVWFVLTDPNSSNRSKAVFITQDPVLGAIQKNISKNDKFYYVKEDFVVVKYAMVRYLNQLDPYYLFGNGLDLSNQDPIDVGPLYLFQLPFVILGIVYLAKKNNFKLQRYFILAWVLIGLIPSGITFEDHSPHRIIMVFSMLNLISALGIYVTFKYISINIQSAFVKSLLLVIFGLIVVWNFSYASYIYIFNYAYDKSENLQYPFREIANFAWTQHDKYRVIILDPEFGEYARVMGTAPVYYLAYYGKYPPENFQKEYQSNKQKMNEVSFDKFTIRKVDWRFDSYLKDTLIIASPWALPVVDKEKVVKKFYYYDGKIAFYAMKL